MSELPPCTDTGGFWVRSTQYTKCHVVYQQDDGRGKPAAHPLLSSFVDELGQISGVCVLQCNGQVVRRQEHFLQGLRKYH